MMQATVNRTTSDVWAITCYFNSSRYKSRLENYHIFRRRLTLPLVAVELSFGGEFELESGDADILIQLSGRDVLWQKERLLNVALGSVPADCDKIAWLDCDVIFERSDWHIAASRSLDQFPLLHLFEERCNLARNAIEAPPGFAPIESVARSVGRRIVQNEIMPDDLRNSDAPLVRGSTAGLAWAARREVLKQHGLYDACVIGTGDRAIVCAALGKFDYAVDALELTGRRVDHFLDWARPFHASVCGNIGCLDGRIYHLWHGDLRDRKYQLRHQGFGKFNFDPFIDIAIDGSGCWRWNSDKFEMHEYVRTYFLGRNEDGILGD
jgi:hypothetical protein